MKSWIVREWCEPHQMKFEESPSPVPGPKQVRVKVEAAALNFLDTLIIKGQYQVKPPFPFTPGVEVAGIIQAVGSESRWKVGMRVCGSVGTGGYATEAIVDDGAVLAIPDNLDFPAASAIPVVYPTAHLCLRDAGRLKEGETVLVHAGAGGVGLAAIQLARAWGAGTILATASSSEKIAVCLREGADQAFDYSQSATFPWHEQVKKTMGSKGVDIIIDMVGGEIAEHSLRVLAWRGRFITVGYAGGTIPNLPANRLLLKAASAIGVFWGETAKREPGLASSVFKDIFELVSAGKVKPAVSATYPLSRAPEAMVDLAKRKTYGKVVLVPD